MRLEHAIRLARRRKCLAFIPFTILGYPDLPRSVSALEFLRNQGAVVYETGIPIGSGWTLETNQVISNALRLAFRQGVGAKDVLQIYSDYRPNLLVAYRPNVYETFETFFHLIRHAVDGVLLEWDSPKYRLISASGTKHGIDIVQAVSPLMPQKTIARKVQAAKGFVYLTSADQTGGALYDVSILQDTVKLIRTYTDLPVCCAFGIRHQEHVRTIARSGADGFIVGTALLEALDENRRTFERLVRELVNAAKV